MKGQTQALFILPLTRRFSDGRNPKSPTEKMKKRREKMSDEINLFEAGTENVKGSASDKGHILYIPFPLELKGFSDKVLAQFPALRKIYTENTRSEVIQQLAVEVIGRAGAGAKVSEVFGCAPEELGKKVARGDVSREAFGVILALSLLALRRK